MARAKKGEAAPAPETTAGETAEDLKAATDALVVADDEAPKIENDATARGEAGDPAVEDHVTQFERRCERLVSIVEEAEFESGTLVGDVRDTLLETFKARPKPWSQMSQGEQADLARSLESAAKTVLRKLVIVIAEEEDVSVHATLKGYAVDGDTFKLKVVAKGDAETAAELFNMDGHEVIMIRADARRHFGQRKDAATDPDQPGLAFADGKPKAPSEITSKPPGDDSDLAGEDDEAEEAEAEEGELFRVKFNDGDDETFLADEQGLTAVTSESAGKWPREQADELAKEFDGEVVEA